MYAPVKVNPDPQITHSIMIGVRLAIQGTLTTVILSDITNGRNIIFRGRSDSDRSWQCGDSDKHFLHLNSLGQPWGPLTHTLMHTDIPIGPTSIDNCSVNLIDLLQDYVL